MAASDPPPEDPAGGPSGPPLPADLAARVEEIVRSAEREAAVISRDLQEHRREAEAQARRYVEEARRRADDLVAQRVQRLRELTDELVSRAEETEKQFDALIAALQRASTRVDGPDAMPGPSEPAASAQPAPAAPPEPRDTPPAPPARSPESQVPPDPGPWPAQPPGTGRLQDSSLVEPRPRGAGPTGGTSNPDLDAARLIAIEMAVGGRTREEVDEHLRESFRLTDTAGMLDDVFGSGRERPPAWIDP